MVNAILGSMNYMASSRRRLMFSSFDPDVCAALRLRQQRIPVRTSVIPCSFAPDASWHRTSAAPQKVERHCRQRPRMSRGSVTAVATRHLPAISSSAIPEIAPTLICTLQCAFLLLQVLFLSDGVVWHSDARRNSVAAAVEVALQHQLQVATCHR